MIDSFSLINLYRTNKNAINHWSKSKLDDINKINLTKFSIETRPTVVTIGKYITLYIGLYKIMITFI